MIVNQFKVAIVFYMVIVMQEQPEFKHDHNHEHHHKHPHDDDHDHHRRSEIRKASRIYNGLRTPLGQAKFMAVIMMPYGSMIITCCSAVIITGDMLLTAAHCLNMSNADLASVRILPNALPIATYKNNPHGRHPLMKKIKKFWIHPRYRINSTDDIFDIAIIQIGPRPWRLGHEVDTALMPVRKRHLDLRKIKGYGFGLEVGEEWPPDYLNELNFRYYWNQTLCQTRNPARSELPDVLFCVSNWSPDWIQNPRIFRSSAPADSGGGIFIIGSVYRFDRSLDRTIIKRGLVFAGIISRAKSYKLSVKDFRRPYGVLAINITTMLPWINSIVKVDFGTYPFPKRPE